MKVVFLTITFKPSLGVTVGNANSWRHRILQSFRRRAEACGVDFHYVAVIELHKSGRPHIHAVVAWISVRSARQVARNAVQGSFVNAKLARDAAVSDYLAKYVTKSGARLTSSRAVSRRAQTVTATGVYELVAVKPPHMSVADWLDSLDIYPYDIDESGSEECELR